MISKRAQFEVIGLLFIVILITLGVLFVVQFVILRDDSNIKQAHTEAQFASSFLNSFLEISAADCYEQQIKSLIHDCVSNPEGWRVMCNNNGRPIDSCNYVNKTALILLNSTLIKQNRAFRFNIIWEEGDEEYVNISRSMERCVKATRIESKRVTLPVSGRDIDLYLKTCS